MTCPRPRFRPAVRRLDDRITPAGWLDPTWGVAGVATVASQTNYYSTAASPSAIAADGGVLVAASGQARYPVIWCGDGSGESSPAESIAPATVTRLTPAGVPDPTFSGDGVAEIADGFFQVTAVAAGPDGTTLVLGTQNGQPTLHRLLADGSPDAGFDGDGAVALSPAGGYTWPTALAVRPDGGAAVVLGGTGVTVVGADGTVGEPVPVPGVDGLPGGGYLSRVLPAADGGLYAVHTGMDGAGSSVTAVTKLTATGDLDVSYGTGGRVLLSAPGYAGHGVEPGPDGGLLVVVRDSAPPTDPVNLPGIWYDPTRTVGLARLDPTGRFDLLFGGDGVAEVGVPEGASNWFTTVALPDGRTAVLAPPLANGCYPSGDQTLYVQVFTAAGSPDAGVADGGWLTVPTDGFSSMWGPFTPAFAVTADRIALTGSHVTGAEPYTYSTRVAVLDLGLDTPAGETVPATETEPASLPTVVTELPPLPDLPICTYPYFPELPPIPIDTPVPPDTGTGGEVWTQAAEAAVTAPAREIVAGPGTPDVVNGSQVPDAPVPPAPEVPPVVLDSFRPAGDLDGDRVPDRLVFDGSRVGVVSGSSGAVLLPLFAPFEAGYTGRLNAVLADLDADGRAELVVSPEDGGGPVVAVYRAEGTQATRFYGIEDPNFRGGVRLAAGDFDANGTTDLVVAAGNGGGPRIAVFDGASLLTQPRKLVADFFAFEPEQRSGAIVAAGDLTADGVPELVFGAAPGGGPRVLVLDGRELAAGRRVERANFFAADPADRGGAAVAVTQAQARAGAGEVVAQVMTPVLRTEAGGRTRVWTLSAGPTPDEFNAAFVG